MRDDAVARFRALVAGDRTEVPLDEACLVAALHARPDLDVEAELLRLDDLAAGVAEPTVDALVEHLVGRAGFAGDRDTYHDARNSLLPDVLDRRLGIPLTLTVVAMEVGRRIGVPIEGIGMPGHFLARAGDGATYLDLFDGGRRLDEAGCRAVFEVLHPRARWEPGFLASVGPRPILARLLGNLAGAHRRSGDKPGLAWALRLRLELPGAADGEHRELAVLLGALGRFDEAATVLEALGTDRDAQSAVRLRARLN